MITDLCEDNLRQIFEYLPMVDRVTTRNVCCDWNQLLQNKALWSDILIEDLYAPLELCCKMGRAESLAWLLTAFNFNSETSSWSHVRLACEGKHIRAVEAYNLHYKLHIIKSIYDEALDIFTDVICELDDLELAKWYVTHFNQYTFADYLFASGNTEKQCNEIQSWLINQLLATKDLASVYKDLIGVLADLGNHDYTDGNVSLSRTVVQMHQSCTDALHCRSLLEVACHYGYFGIAGPIIDAHYPYWDDDIYSLLHKAIAALSDDTSTPQQVNAFVEWIMNPPSDQKRSLLLAAFMHGVKYCDVQLVKLLADHIRDQAYQVGPSRLNILNLECTYTFGEAVNTVSCTSDGITASTPNDLIVLTRDNHWQVRSHAIVMTLLREGQIKTMLTWPQTAAELAEMPLGAQMALHQYNLARYAPELLGQ